MSTKKTPLALVKERFGTKEKLVQAVLGLPSGILERPQVDGKEEDKETFQKRLLAISNQKLMKLYQLGQALGQRKWNNKEKIVDTLLQLIQRSKDKPYRAKLLDKSTAWLYDRLVSIEKKNKSAQAAKSK